MFVNLPRTSHFWAKIVFFLIYKFTQKIKKKEKKRGDVPW
jgi:hypothetical protein